MWPPPCVLGTGAKHQNIIRQLRRVIGVEIYRSCPVYRQSSPVLARSDAEMTDFHYLSHQMYQGGGLSVQVPPNPLLFAVLRWLASW